MMNSRRALRRLVQRVPGARAVTETSTPLERLGSDPEAPHLIDAEAVEDATLRARTVPGTPDPAVVGFLDGAQESHVIAWIGAAPVVYGRVSAAVRERQDRRLRTWHKPLTRAGVYAPMAFVPAADLAAAFPGDELSDTAPPDGDGALPSPHPLHLLERARIAVARDRELAERALAEHWCATRTDVLLVDGGTSGSEATSTAPQLVGVVKSHRSIYATGDDLVTILSLGAGERTSVMRIAPRGRHPVLSWYLRLRSADGRGALWALVRVEVSECSDITARAHEVSRWVLAERSPLATPDPRWDVMSYGVRACEAYLHAIR